MEIEQPTAAALPPELEVVRQRIEEWRQTRSKRTRMPEDLWQAAVAVARKHGTWRVARALRVRHDGLKSRVAPAKPKVSPEPASPTGFIDMTPMLSSTRSESAATTIELSRADGTRLSLRLPDNGLDPQSLIRAFCEPSQ